MNKNLIPLLLVSSLALTGCDKKKETPPTPPAPAQQRVEKPAGTSDQASAGTLESARKAGEQVVEQTKVAAEQVVEQAKVAAGEVKEQARIAVNQMKSEAGSIADALKKPAGDDAAKLDFAALSAKVAESAKRLLADPAVTGPVKEQLGKLTDAVLGNRDGAATAALNKIVALKPSESQMGLLKELQSNLGAIALGRNFDATGEASGGAVRETIDAIRAKDTAAILGGLQKIGSTAKLTDAQKEIIGNLVSSYGGKLAGVTDTVNKASETLKGFGF